MPDTGVYLIQSYSYKEGYLRGGNQGSVDLVPVIVDAQPLANQFLIEKVPNKFTYYIRKSAAPPTGAQVAPSFTTVSDEALYLTTTPYWEVEWYITYDHWKKAYVIYKADDYAHWELTSPNPGSQVAVKSKSEQKEVLAGLVAQNKTAEFVDQAQASKFSENALWYLIKPN
ncbi:hypothetical protein AcV5_009910 [Taiwanofungus camphoratus]|nr:hypothetical protein AcV5_009910 [Antrodia cinnamomea]